MTSQPTETSIPIGDWTIGSLKAHHDMMISYERQVADERDKQYSERWKAQEVAGKRYQDVSNEFRGSLDDLSSKMATKVELTTAFRTLSEKTDTLSALIGELRSRLDVGNPAIQSQLDNNSGRNIGKSETIAYVVTAISIAFGVVGVIMGLN